MSSSSHEVTRLLLAWGDGDRAAFDRLIPLVYSELRRMARGYMRQQDPDHTLQTTALIHEAYLRLVDQKQARFQNREHFFGVAAKAMRHILVDHARGRQADKRGGAAVKVPLDEAAVAAEEKAANLIALNGALDRLAEFDRESAVWSSCDISADSASRRRPRCWRSHPRRCSETGGLQRSGFTIQCRPTAEY